MGDPGKNVRNRLWRDGRLETEDFPFADISDHLEEDGALVWVDLCDPSREQLQALADELTLDPLAVEDAVGRAERSKATRYANHTFITVYAVDRPPDESLPVDGEDRHDDESGDLSGASGRLGTTRISAFVLHRGVVTVRRGSGFDMDAVVRRWDDNSDLLKYGVGALVHGLLDVIVDGHFEAVQALDDAIEEIEDGLFDERAQGAGIQRRTYQLRKDLVDLRRVVLPMREVVNAVLRHRKDIDAPHELDGWYDDLYDHVLRATEWTESLREMVSTIFETNLSLQDARLNTVMKKLTSWAAIIAVPTAVTGYFGQNVPYPGFGESWGFATSLAVILVMAFVLYVSFRRRGWL